MDPATLIATALLTGAAAGLTETTAASIRGLHARLRDLIRQKMASRKEAAALPEDPKALAAVKPSDLAAALSAAGVADDRDIVMLAQQLMGRLDPAGTRAGKYQVIDLHDAKGVQIGDHNVQVNQF